MQVCKTSGPRPTGFTGTTCQACHPSIIENRWGQSAIATHKTRTRIHDNTVCIRLYQLATTQTCTHKLHLFETPSTGRRLSQIGAHCALILAMHSTVLARVAFPQEHHIHGSNVAGVRHVSAIAHEDIVFVRRGCVVQLQVDVCFPANPHHSP